MPATGIYVQGLREFRRGLRAMSATLPKEMGRRHQKLADRIARKAAARASAQGGSIAKAAPGLKASRAQTSPTINWRSVPGSGSTPLPPHGPEFGAVRYPQFRPHRGSGPDAGYALFPTIRDEENYIIDEMADMVNDLARVAFPS